VEVHFILSDAAFYLDTMYLEANLQGFSTARRFASSDLSHLYSIINVITLTSLYLSQHHIKSYLSRQPTTLDYPHLEIIDYYSHSNEP